MAKTDGQRNIKKKRKRIIQEYSQTLRERLWRCISRAMCHSTPQLHVLHTRGRTPSFDTVSAMLTQDQYASHGMPYRNAQSCNYIGHNAIKALNISSFVTNYFCSLNAQRKSFFPGHLRSSEMLRRAAACYRLLEQPIAPSSSVKKSETVWTAVLMKMGTLGCPDVSVTSCQPGRRNIQDERSFKLHRSRSLKYRYSYINPLNPELNPTCYLLALLGAHHFLHVSRIRVKLLTFRLLMSYIYGAAILDSRSHTTTRHSQ